MKRKIFSQSWHSVAPLKPKLLSQARIFRHKYRGKLWYIIQDPSGGRYHRLTPAAHNLLQKMNGKTTVQKLWDDTCQLNEDELPTQDEIVELLMQLHSNDLLSTDVTPDAAELFQRFRKRRSQKWKQALMNPMGLKIPLLDPDIFLTKCLRYFSWLFDKRGAILWFALVMPALFLAGQHWNELTANLSDQVLAAENLLLLMIVYAIIKATHEVGHGLATKVWGGTVHEMGIMLLVFAPIPYVDASSASSFQSKHQRAIVAAAGILVEVALAAIAMYVWLLVEPGLIRAIAFDVMFVAGISTVLINGNPLLRFDGYYIFTDLIEMPNMAQRGQRYLTYLSDRYLFGAKETESPDETTIEKRWLFFYTIASWLYRFVLMITIAMFVAGQFFIFGVLLALWSIGMFLGKPLWKSIKHLKESPTLQRNRPRAIRTSIALLALVIICISLVPMPLRTTAEGVIWLSENALIRTGTAGFFDKWLVEPGTHVEKNTPLFIMHNSELKTEYASAKSRLAEATARYKKVQFSSPSTAEVILQQLQHEQLIVNRLIERNKKLVIYSKTSGVLSALKAQDMHGKYFKQGELLAYILDNDNFIVRAAVEQTDIELVQSKVINTQIRLADDLKNTYPSKILYEVPSGSDQLPTAALSPNGGGQIAVDPTDSSGLKPLQRVFLFDLTLPNNSASHTFGGRVYVRFEHEFEPLFHQWYRRIRQLFLSHFYV
ncbi:MAG: peptidase M50 [Gammaproteobacteria bacterium]|nr:peptidase M50 [Gammaproteobacteria bacterium]